MTRYVGKSLQVYVNSQTVVYALGWSMETDDQTAEHFGVGMTIPELETVYSRRRGSFECEGDPNDGVQTTLLAGPTEGSLLLHEIDGVWTTVANARISGGRSVTRSGKLIRRFQWVEIPE